jgi:hypothetical protein
VSDACRSSTKPILAIADQGNVIGFYRFQDDFFDNWYLNVIIGIVVLSISLRKYLGRSDITILFPREEGAN